MDLNKVYHGDCLELMQEISDKSVDLILCDLPYGTTDCKWDTSIPFKPLWEHYKRIIKDNGAIVLTASQPFTSALIMSNATMFKYCWVWNKVSSANPQQAKFQPLKQHEDICVFGKGKLIYNPQGLIEFDPPKVCINGKRKGTGLPHLNVKHKEYIQTHTNYPRSIITFPRPVKPQHPTQKPVELFEYIIRTYTNEGAVVLDNCAGAMTTAIACINTNRNYICIEMDHTYYSQGVERIEKHVKKK